MLFSGFIRPQEVGSHQGTSHPPLPAGISGESCPLEACCCRSVEPLTNTQTPGQLHTSFYFYCWVYIYIDSLQSLKQFFINVSHHMLVASLTLMCFGCLKELWHLFEMILLIAHKITTYILVVVKKNNNNYPLLSGKLYIQFIKG